jgi:hypothetical protein
MDIAIVASSLVSLMLSHQRNQLLGRPALGLKVIVIRSRCTSVHLFHKSAMLRSLQRTSTHHKVDRRTSAKDMSTRHHSTSPTQPFRRSGVVKRSSLTIQLHISWINTRTINPRIVEVRLSSFNKHNLKIVIQISQSASNNTTANLLVITQHSIDK